MRDAEVQDRGRTDESLELKSSLLYECHNGLCGTTTNRGAKPSPVCSSERACRSGFLSELGENGLDRVESGRPTSSFARTVCSPPGVVHWCASGVVLATRTETGTY